MNSELPPQIAEPCPKSWEEMKGDAKRRFCEHCHLHVHNLSEMTALERKKLLASEGRLCVAYETNASGALVTRENTQGFGTFFIRLRWAFLAFIAFILPFGFSSCSTRRTLGAPMPPSPPSNGNQTTKDNSHNTRRPIVRGKVSPPSKPQENNTQESRTIGVVNWEMVKERPKNKNN